MLNKDLYYLFIIIYLDREAGEEEIFIINLLYQARKTGSKLPTPLVARFFVFLFCFFIEQSTLKQVNMQQFDHQCFSFDCQVKIQRRGQTLIISKT